MRRAAILALMALAGCYDELDRDADHSKAIANSAAEISSKADEMVNQSIERMGPVEASGSVENTAENGTTESD